MSLLEINKDLTKHLKGRVVVLTGGATGIGRETVRQFHKYGAKVVFGDILDGLGRELQNDLNSSMGSGFNSNNIRFQHCDATSYSDQLLLFQKALELYGKIDIVVANAGISLPQDPFLPDQDVTKEPSTKEIDVNLKGALFTARIGLHYLRENGKGEGDLILVSSIAGFKESTGLAIYTASKHGVVGLMRGQRVHAMREGNRINVVCPWMTRMVKGIEEGWREKKLPENKPVDVAKSIVICATANRGPKKDFWGKMVFVAGGKSYEIEDKLWELEPQWLGKENSEVLEVGQAYLMDPATSWDPSKKSKL